MEAATASCGIAQLQQGSRLPDDAQHHWEHETCKPVYLHVIGGVAVEQQWQQQAVQTTACVLLILSCEYRGLIYVASV